MLLAKGCHTMPLPGYTACVHIFDPIAYLTSPALTWQPWAAPSRIEHLERCQNEALRMVARQLKPALVETLRREAGICRIATAAKRATVLAYEKAHQKKNL